MVVDGQKLSEQASVIGRTLQPCPDEFHGTIVQEERCLHVVWKGAMSKMIDGFDFPRSFDFMTS